jgi:hypothetical protein
VPLNKLNNRFPRTQRATGFAAPIADMALAFDDSRTPTRLSLEKVAGAPNAPAAASNRHRIAAQPMPDSRESARWPKRNFL